PATGGRWWPSCPPTPPPPSRARPSPWTPEPRHDDGGGALARGRGAGDPRPDPAPRPRDGPPAPAPRALLRDRRLLVSPALPRGAFRGPVPLHLPGLGRAVQHDLL